jgi:cytochrome P450
MAGIEQIFGEIIEARRSLAPVDDFLDQILDSYADLPDDERSVAAARDVIVIHMGSQSNLYAALAWTLVNLVQRPELLARVRAGDGALLDRCAHESIRMAQRSITLRQVLTPIEVDTGVTSYRLHPGVLLCTMLSSHNTSAAPGLDRFDPDHYEGRRLSAAVHLPTKELVSTFGHGVHTCPAARFSISAIRVATQGLLDRFDLTPHFTRAVPRRRQIGGVARSARPCRVGYRRR